MNPSTIIALVQADLFEREKRGLNKYGTTVDRKDLSDLEWLQHAYEEALDLAVYLKKTIQSKKGIEEPKPKFDIHDTVIYNTNNNSATITRIQKIEAYYFYELSTGETYMESELELIEESPTK